MTAIASLPQVLDRIASGDAFDYLHLRGYRQRADGHASHVDRAQSHHCLQSYRLGEIMTVIMKITHHFLARVGQVNKATQAT